MRVGLVSVGILGVLWLGIGCNSAVLGGSADETPVYPDPSRVIEANLAGCWEGSASVISATAAGTNTDTMSQTFLFQGSTVIRSSRQSGEVGGVITYSPYFESRGTYSLSGDQLTMTFTASRQSDVPFPDAVSGWVDDTKPSPGTTKRAAMIDGRLYGLGPLEQDLFKAEGKTQGLLGTWEWFEVTTADYHSSRYQVSSDQIVMENRQGASEDSTAVISTITGTWSEVAPNTVTFKSDQGPSTMK